MDCKLTMVLLVSLLLIMSGCLCGGADAPRAPPQFSAMFVFGDSLVDSGNNNYLNSLAKANYVPYGIDFYLGPTGRFSNGKTFIDFLAELLDLPTPGNYINTADILKGVNYASAAAGILDESGRALGERYSLEKQILNFESTLDQLRSGMKEGDMYQFLGDAFVVMVFGSNDYLNNYLQPSMYTSSSQYNPQDYANLLLNRYTTQIEALYGLGFRQFFLVGLGPLGCIPNQRATESGSLPGECVSNVNDMVRLFNTGLNSLADQLNTNHRDGVFAYGDTYDACMDIITNPASYGIKVVDNGCCGIGRNRGEVTCLPLSIPCENRGEYMFWDAFHPTEVVNQILSLKAYNGPITSSQPLEYKAN